MRLHSIRKRREHKNLNDRKYYRSKFRTKSSLKAEYGKKLKSGRDGRNILDSDEKKKARRIYGSNGQRSQDGDIIGDPIKITEMDATGISKEDLKKRRLRARHRKKVLEGRKESEELLGVKAQMIEENRHIQEDNYSRNMSQITDESHKEFAEHISFMNSSEAEKSNVYQAEVVASHVFGKSTSGTPGSRLDAMRRTTSGISHGVIGAAGLAASVATSVVGSACTPDGTDDDNSGDDAIREGIRATEEAGRRFNESVYRRKLKREHREERKNSNEQNPKDGSNPKSRAAQKKKRRKSYYEREKEREAARGGLTTLEEIAEKISEKLSDIAAAIVAFVEENPKLFVAIIIIMLMIIMLCTLMSSCALVMPAMNDGGATSSYSAYDEDIKGVEKDYRKLEEDLEDTISKTPELYPGYDEYEYELDETGHDPYQLAAFLTAKYDDYKRKDMKNIIKEIFKKQYKLTYSERQETRTRKVQKIGLRWVEDQNHADGGYYEQYTYEVDEQYTVKILKVKLDNKGLDHVIEHSGMTDKQKKHYELLMYTRGNKEYLFEDIYGDGDDDEYHVPGEALTDQQFAAMIAEAEKYLGRAYVWGGSNPTTGFDCSGFVCWVLNHTGWHVGRTTAQGLRKFCTQISPEEAKPGDLIFFQGTYDTPGASHVGIYVGDGMMIHCGNPISYASVNTKYWQNHFLCYGRLP